MIKTTDVRKLSGNSSVIGAQCYPKVDWKDIFGESTETDIEVCEFEFHRVEFVDWIGDKLNS